MELLLGRRGPALELLLRWSSLELLLRRSALKLCLLWDLSLELALSLLLGHLTLELLLLLLELSRLGRWRVASLELALGNPGLLVLLRVDTWRSSVLTGDSAGQEEDGDNVVLELYHGQAGRERDFTVSSCI